MWLVVHILSENRVQTLHSACLFHRTLVLLLKQRLDHENCPSPSARGRNAIQKLALSSLC